MIEPKEGRELELSPSHYAYFEISRTLLVLEVFTKKFPEAGIKFENLMLIDFCCQYPRIASSLLPELEMVLIANEHIEADISDLFVRDKIENINEKFSFLISSLVSRDLARLKISKKDSLNSYIFLTSKGQEVALLFSSRFSFYIRELADVLIGKWYKSDHSRVIKEIFENLPENYGERMALSMPFQIWKDED